VSPAESLIHTLHPWVAFGIMPIFALANAGVSVGGTALDATGLRVMASVAIGLVLGKPAGILFASWITVRLGLSHLPTGVTWRQITVLGVVAGIGFTMALFIAELAFESPALLGAAKLGVLAASGAAAVLSMLLGRMLLAPSHAPSAAPTADEAEASTEH
jgi:NhaA family Na+:H+ antiporter